MPLDFANISWWVRSGDILFSRLERGLAWAVIATVFFLPISEALKNVAFVVSLTLYVAAIFTDRKPIVVPPGGWLFLAFLGAAIVSAGVSAYPRKAVQGVWEVFRYTSFPFIVARGIREERHVRAVLWAAVTGLGLTALVTVPRYLSHHVVFARSLGGNDTVALYAVMVLALIFGISVHTSFAGWQWIWLIVAAALSVMLLGMTHVRMLWGGFIVVGLVLGWLRSVRLASTALAISMLIVFGVALTNPTVSSQVKSLGDTEVYKTIGEGGVRLEQWKKALAMWRDTPWLGIGPKGFILHENIANNPRRGKYGAVGGHPHNMWLYTAVETGGVGLLILGATFGYLGFWLLRWRKCFPSSWPAAVWDGTFGSWLAIMVAGLTSPGFGGENAMLFLMLLALLRPGVAGGERKR